MIDIHCHLLCGVDDGAKSLEESQEMLKIAASQNINKIILTPHRRHGMFAYPVEAIDSQYKILKECGQKLGVELYLGTEYHVDSDMINSFKSGRCHTLAGGRYMLTEYSHVSEYTFIKTMTKESIFINKYGFFFDLWETTEKQYRNGGQTMKKKIMK